MLEKNELTQLQEYIQKGYPITYYPAFSIQLAKYLLKQEAIQAHQILISAFYSKIGLREQLFDFALLNHANLEEIDALPNSISISEVTKLLNHGLHLDRALTLVYRENKNFFSKTINFILQQGANINNLFEKIIVDSFNEAYFNTFPKTEFLITEDVIKTLIHKYQLNPNLALEYAIIQGDKNMANLALEYNADPNAKSSMDLERPIILLASLLSIDMVDFLIQKNAKAHMDILDYVKIIKKVRFDNAYKLAKIFAKTYTQEELYQIIRFNGESDSDAKTFMDMHSLILEYIDNNRLLSNLASGREFAGGLEHRSRVYIGVHEDSSTEPTQKLPAEVEIPKKSNRYGYTDLHLAIITDQFELARELVKTGSEIYELNHNNISSLQLAVYLYSKPGISSFIESIEHFINDVDVMVANGQSIADRLITNSKLKNKIIAQSQDQLFYFFKKDADLFSPSKNPNKTYIAISHGDDFWSTGIWSAARLIMKNHPRAIFHLVNQEAISNGGDQFIKQFDAIINPGADDSFPRIAKFTKEDCPFSRETELHYQNMLDLSSKLNIPYLGICAGSQHLALYNGGSLTYLGDGQKSNNMINFIKGTLPYFLSLTKNQQIKTLSDCDFPEITFTGFRAHKFAAIKEILGNNMQLGAVSKDEIAMAYGLNNGIAYATQYHPEYHYNEQNSNALNQNAWIDNFIEIANMHHDYRLENKSHPLEYFAQVSMALNNCLVQFSEEL